MPSNNTNLSYIAHNAPRMLRGWHGAGIKPDFNRYGPSELCLLCAFALHGGYWDEAEEIRRFGRNAFGPGLFKASLPAQAVAFVLPAVTINSDFVPKLYHEYLYENVNMLSPAHSLALRDPDDFVDMSFVKENSAETILKSACDSGSALPTAEEFWRYVTRCLIFAVVLDPSKAADMKSILIGDNPNAKQSMKKIINELRKDESAMQYLGKMKDDVLGIKKESLTEAAISYSEQVQKMDDWHNGRRKQNVKACSDAKLMLNFEICIDKCYPYEYSTLFKEMQDRGLTASATCLGEYLLRRQLLPADGVRDQYSEYALGNYEQLRKNGLNTFFSWSNWQESYLARLVSISHSEIALIANLLYSLVGAIAKGRATLVKYLRNLLTKAADPATEAYRKSELKKFITETMKDKAVMQILTDAVDAEKQTKQEALTEGEEIQEDIEKHDELNPKLFDENDKLRPEVREKLLEIADDFIDKLKDDEVKFELADVKIVGSNCSYNYNKDSDLDLHLVADTKTLKCPDDLYPLLYSAYRTIWNKNHDVDIYGIPVEIFVETDDTEQMGDEKPDQLEEARAKTALRSNGVYSVLRDEWIKKPVQTDIPDIDMDAFDALLSEWNKRYEELPDDVDVINEFIEDLYDARKTGIRNEGEYCLPNLVFKDIRSTGKLEELKERKAKLIDANLSLD